MYIMFVFQGKGIFLTARGQDINRQPNILYITTDHGRSWTALHEFVNVRSISINSSVTCNYSVHTCIKIYINIWRLWPILCISCSRNVSATTKTSMISWFINWTCTKLSATYVSLFKIYIHVNLFSISYLIWKFLIITNVILIFL